MKCIGCGKKIADRATVCPHCGKVQSSGEEDFDDFSSDSELLSGGNDFDTEPVSAIPVRRSFSLGKRELLLITVGVLLVLTLIALLFLHNRKPAEIALPAFVSPTGHTERIDDGRSILLNELLVIPEDTMTRNQLEIIAREQGGALTGFFPEIGQYQIRFNFSTRQELDDCRRAIEAKPGIIRVDYNLLLTVSCATDPVIADIPAGNDEKIGVLGYWIPEYPEHVSRYYLPSIAYPTDESLVPGDGNVTGNSEYLPAKWSAILQKLAEGRFVLLASAFYYDHQEDGSLFVTTTSAALRYQLAKLLSSGAEWVCIPVMGPVCHNEQLLEQETEQMDLLIAAAEKKNPKFMIFTAQNGNDLLSLTIHGSDASRSHCLTVSSSGEPCSELLDLAALDIPVFCSTGSLAQADLCVSADYAETASIQAAVYASRLFFTSGESSFTDFRQKLSEEAYAVTGDGEGNVRPALIGIITSLDTPVHLPENTRFLSLRVQDNISGLLIPNVLIHSETGAGGTLSSASGVAVILACEGAGIVSVSADGYQDRQNQDVFLSNGIVELMPVDIEETTGILQGHVVDASGSLSGDVIITAREAGTDTIRLNRTAGESFDLRMYAGKYDITITSYDRTEETVYGVTIRPGETSELPEIQLSIPSDIKGQVSGTIKNAMDGHPLGGVTLRFFRGLNASNEGTPDLETVTGNDGMYRETLPGGVYTLHISKEGFRSVSINVRSEGEKLIGGQNCTITPTVPEGQVRIVLEWGEKPSDLDSHLVNRKQGIHVYYSNMSAYIGERKVVNLDVDDMHSYGPETTTILQMLSGKYVFYVHDYSNNGKGMNSNALSLSGAKVTVYMGSNDPLIFHVPSGNGVVWEVFSMENGVITPGSGMVAERTMW